MFLRARCFPCLAAPLRVRPAFARPLLALATVAATGWPMLVQAQAQAPTGAQAPEAVGLPSPLPEPTPPAGGWTVQSRRQAPVLVEGARMSGEPDRFTTVQGDAALRKADTLIQADTLEYDHAADIARAQGQVRVERNANRYEGPRLEISPGTGVGFFEQPRYEFREKDAHGQADRAEFLDEAHMVVHNATYTTCRRLPGPSWMPDWILRATTIAFDNDEEVGVAEGAFLSFKDLPILPVPAFSFPLTEKRKSGFLPPQVGVNNVNGSEVVVPYYWNIAPNRDATITSTLMTARGVDVGAEFRYLEPSYTGSARLNYMPSDQLRDADRWGLNWLHNGTVQTGLPGVSPVAVTANVNRVSDDNYWRDFSRSAATLTQRLLPGDVQAAWSMGHNTGLMRVLQWQTLQDPDSPIVPPYDRLPQLTLRHARFNQAGLDWSVEGDYTRFSADSRRTLQPNAQRGLMVAQVSRPWLAPQGFFTPKLQWHASAYSYDQQLSDGSGAASSVVPTFSVDAGLVFERAMQWGSRDLLQTLEPRAFYVRTPYVDQTALPNYDTAANDFNFATIFTENAFVGHDKISDNNLLTLGLTSRILSADTGAQLARFGLAQRLRLEDQRVTLNSASAPARAGLSDVLLGASVNVDQRWTLDSTLQYNSETAQSVRSTLGARYQPGPYRVFNVAHRFQRDISEQIDMSWQWPLNDLWGDRGQDLGPGRGQGPGRTYALGRMNYSISEGRLVDTLVGLEYDAGCWLGRFVVARTQTSASTATQSLWFQIEFVGFTRVGLDPRAALTQSISRYQSLRDSASGPISRTNF